MEKKKFLKTGEFARLCHTTKETLFHYDRQGLLKPRLVSDNGYRRYGLGQFFDFDMISLLQESGSTLGKIRSCRGEHDPYSYLCLLRSCAEHLEKNRKRMAQREAMLLQLIKLTEETLSADFDELSIEEKTEEEHIVIIPIKSGKTLNYEDAIKFYSESTYYNTDYEYNINVPIGFIVQKEVAEKGELHSYSLFTIACEYDNNVQDIARGKYFVFYHKGDDESQSLAYKKMIKQILYEGFRIVGPTYVYYKMSYFIMDSETIYIAKYVIHAE